MYVQGQLVQREIRDIRAIHMRGGGMSAGMGGGDDERFDQQAQEAAALEGWSRGRPADDGTLMTNDTAALAGGPGGSGAAATTSLLRQLRSWGHHMLDEAESAVSMLGMQAGMASSSSPSSSSLADDAGSDDEDGAAGGGAKRSLSGEEEAKVSAEEAARAATWRANGYKGHPYEPMRRLPARQDAFHTIMAWLHSRIPHTRGD